MPLSIGDQYSKRIYSIKNIVLSATPKDIHVPDPFTQGLKVERLPEINESPVVFYKPIEDLSKVGLKKPVENF